MIFCLKDGKTDEQVLEIETNLINCDYIKHPLHEMHKLRIFQKISKLMGSKGSSSDTEQVSPESRHTYIPPWYRGESANAKVGMAMMKQVPTLPKMK